MNNPMSMMIDDYKNPVFYNDYIAVFFPEGKFFIGKVNAGNNRSNISISICNLSKDLQNAIFKELDNYITNIFDTVILKFEKLKMNCGIAKLIKQYPNDNTRFVLSSVDNRFNGVYTIKDNSIVDFSYNLFYFNPNVELE